MNFLQLQHTELAADEHIPVRVMHSFNAENDGDLALTKGDLITVTHRDDSGWWTGVDGKGNEGVFPMNFVRVEQKEQGGKRPKSAAKTGEPRPESETDEESTDSAEAGPPVPDGWAAVASQSRPGEMSYVNIHTGEKISWLPAEPASREPDQLPAPPPDAVAGERAGVRRGSALLSRIEGLPAGWTGPYYCISLLPSSTPVSDRFIPDTTLFFFFSVPSSGAVELAARPV